MELNNDFRVGVPVAEAWDVLTDVERIAPCMPGAQLEEVDGDQYRGVVKIKVGPITAAYKGVARFIELDAEAHRAVLRAEGRETRGQGNANATITATLTADDDGTRVQVLTELTVTGRVAQFGRGVMADVSSKLLGQFVACLEETVLAAGQPGPIPAAAPAPAAAPSAAAAPAPAAVPSAADEAPAEVAGVETPPAESVRRIEPRETAPIDLVSAAGGSVAKRVAGPVLAVVALGWLVRVLLKRRRG